MLLIGSLFTTLAVVPGRPVASPVEPDAPATARAPSLPPDTALKSDKAPFSPWHRPTARKADYTYNWSEGFIGAGGDVEPPQIMTIQAALKHCDSLPACRAITYSGANDTTANVNVYFKNSA